MKELPSLHVAIIMDGNGRWATRQGLAREAGHVAGAARFRSVVEAAPALGITTLTTYAISSANLRRPQREVDGLFGLLRNYLARDISPLVSGGVRFRVIGRRDRLPGDILDLIRSAEAATQGGQGLDLRLAVDYSGRDALLDALRSLPPKNLTREAISQRLVARFGGPEVDLLIRTSGEQRLSDFLVWEAAFAELYFTPTLWPDFDAAALMAALRDFRTRQRRFGGVPDDDAVSAPVHRAVI
jgi:undecaprenyl diphosphate synthase